MKTVIFWVARRNETYKILHMASATYSLLQSSPTSGLHVAELFPTNKKGGRRQVTNQ